MPSLFFVVVLCHTVANRGFGTAQNGVASLTFSWSKSGYCGTCTKPGKDRWFCNIICDRNRAARSDLLVTYAMRDRQVRDICEGG
jgi:hypothetical protein